MEDYECKLCGQPEEIDENILNDERWGWEAPLWQQDSQVKAYEADLCFDCYRGQTLEQVT